MGHNPKNLGIQNFKFEKVNGWLYYKSYTYRIQNEVFQTIVH